MLAAPSAISARSAPSATPAAIAARALVRLCASAKGKWKRCVAGRGRDQRLGHARPRPAPRPPRRRRRGRSAAAAARRSQVRLQLAGLDRDDRGAVGRQRVEDLRLGGGDRLDRAEQLDVDRADVGDHRRRRARRSPPARRSGRRRASPSPAPGVSVSSGASRIVSGSPISVLRFSRLAWTRPGQQRPGDVLDRGLADRAGDAEHPGAERPPPGAGQRLQRRQRIVDGEDPAPPPSPSRRRAIRRMRRARGRRPRPRRPASIAAGGELAAVAVARRAGRRRGRRRRSPRSRSSPAAAGSAAALGEHLGARSPRRSPRALEPHAGLPSLRSSSRATSRSSKGILRPPSNSWPCSWPLPAITTVSPGSARPSASAIAARRSTSTSTLGAALARPAATSATIAAGSSERGLSEVTIGEVGELAAGPAHHRALVAVAVAAGAEDRDQPARGQPPRGAQHVLDRVGRVGVVDEDGERPGPRRSARSAPAPAPPRPARAAAASGVDPERRRRREAPRARSRR